MEQGPALNFASEHACNRTIATKKLRIKDPMSGFFVVRRACIEGIDLQPQGFKILLEILVKGRIQSAVEVPFHFATRQSGKAKQTLGSRFTTSASGKIVSLCDFRIRAAMKICLVTAFPPSREALNEYGFHVARELQQTPGID